ncbi:MAG: hypothetical protein Q8P67_26845, partial [archaeon]|nr:hypothetical protein [archaeon]
MEWTEIFQKPHPKLAKLGHEVLEERKLLLIDYLYSNVLLRVLSEYRQDTPLSPALSEQIEDHCFDFWRKMSVKTKIPDLENKKIIADLFSSVIGVLSSTRLDHVSRKLFRELGSPEEVHTKDLVTLTPLCQGLRFLKLSYTSPESLSVSMQFVSKLSQFFDAKHKKIFPELKLALCDLLASSITPLIETPQSSSMDFNVWNSCIHDMVSKVVLFEKGQRSSPTTQILKAALISVGGPTLFGEHINPLLETLFKTVKPGDKQRINSLEAIYRILLALFSQGFDDALVSKVCVKLSREILPPQKKTHDPLEGSVDILVDITTLIAISKPEFAVQHFIIPLLRGDKVFPERLIVGLLSANAILSRKEALYTGQLAGSSGAETAPPLSCRDSQDSWSGNLTSMKVAPGEPSEQQKGTLGKSFRKATLIRKSASSGMMRDPSETTAVELLHMNVPPALERILPLVQKEVGSFTQAYGPDVIPTNKAPLLEL